MEELQQRFQELEAQLERHAEKAKNLRDQGLHELANREDERWKAVSAEYVTVGNQIEDQRHSQPRQLSPNSPTPGEPYEQWLGECVGSWGDGGTSNYIDHSEEPPC